jgi:hypothetical protein
MVAAACRAARSLNQPTSTSRSCRPTTVRTASPPRDRSGRRPVWLDPAGVTPAPVRRGKGPPAYGRRPDRERVAGRIGHLGAVVVHAPPGDAPRALAHRVAVVGLHGEDEVVGDRDVPGVVGGRGRRHPLELAVHLGGARGARHRAPRQGGARLAGRGLGVEYGGRGGGLAHQGAARAGPSAPAPGAPTTAVSPSATAPTAMAAFRRRWRFSGGAATITGVTGVSGSLDCLPASATCSVHAVPFQ